MAENTREADLEEISARGKFYDANGIVLAGERAWEGDRIPPGRDWSFEISMQSMPYQATEPTNHGVLLDTRTYEIRG